MKYTLLLTISINGGPTFTVRECQTGCLLTRSDNLRIVNGDYESVWQALSDAVRAATRREETTQP